MEIIVLIIVGGIIGFASAFFGIGGGSLIVPTLYSIYPMLSHEPIIATSLLAIFIVTISNTFQFCRQGLTPPIHIIFNFLVSAGIGAYLGSLLTNMIDTDLSKKIIASVLMLIVLKLFFFQKTQDEDEIEEVPDTLKLSFIAFIGAFISSISGLGGGVIFLPLLLSFAKLPMKKLSPYSNMAMLVATLMGAVPHLFFKNLSFEDLPEILNNSFIGHVNISIALILSTCALMTSRFGVKFNDLISASKKKYLLATLLMGLSLKLFFT